jgi:TolB-like protein
MRLLLYLAEHAGEVVSIDELLSQVWAGVIVTPDSVYQAVTSLRRLLGDDAKQPSYIATVTRLGYRMVAKVGPWTDPSSGDAPASETAAPTTRPRGRSVWFAAAFALALVVAVLGYLRGAYDNHSASPALAAQPQKSIAVLPFLDLTEGMHEETFADGMTEELINKFSKIPGLQVASPTSSFYYKDKQVPVAEIAKALSVAYVLDGSVRKSGDRLRVSTRLARAENGYVVWSETYDRPSADLLMLQDDIAGEVAKALKASIDTGQR